MGTKQDSFILSFCIIRRGMVSTDKNNRGGVARGPVTVCGILLLVLLRTDTHLPSRKTCTRIVIGMLLCVLIGYFALQPFMAEIRTAAANNGGVMDEILRARFRMLHGVASMIYFLQSALAVALIIKIRI